MKLDENALVPLGGYESARSWVQMKLQEFARAINRNAPGLDYAVLNGGNQFTGAQTVAFVTLTDAATINTDANLSNSFAVTLGGNRTLANPTNMRDGGIYNWRVKQDGTGSRTLAYGSKFKWPAGTAPVLSTAGGAVDVIVGQYHAADDRIEAVCTNGFA